MLRMLKIKHTHTLPILIICFLFLVACQPQPPILVYVTPTQAGEIAAVNTVVPTLEPSLSPTEVTPSATFTQAATETPPPQPTGPTATFIGAVIQPGYTLPPTSTPEPSITPPPPNTPVPGATQPPVEQPTSAPNVAPQGALPNLNPSLMGIQLDPTLDQTDWNNALGDIQKLGIKWLKVQVAWKQLQPNNAQEISVDFRRLEIYLETAYNQGLDVLISIAKAPNWARANQSEDGPPDDPQALADFLNLFLYEVGPSIDAIEIWNEPNLSREWQGHPLTGQSYMEYFVPAYNVARQYADTMAVDPRFPRNYPLYVITAGLAPTQGEGAADDRTYLQQMYAAGLAQYTNENTAIGAHPYGWGNPPDATCCSPGEPGFDDNPRFFFLDTIDDYREIMTNAGDNDGKMWLTEVGWATWAGLPGDPPDVWMDFTDECQQGNYLVRAFQMAQERDFMGPMILWNLNFAVLSGMVDNRDERAAYSLIVPLDPRERAAYWMIYDAVRPDENLPSYSRCPGVG
jgi:polysaccharide biosynthesis protein PslG